MNAADSAPPLPAVHTIGLTRTYGAMTALNSLDLTVMRGDLFGFIGSNGAGKTTTLRILATFLAPSAGQAKVLGPRCRDWRRCRASCHRLHAGFLRRL